MYVAKPQTPITVVYTINKGLKKYIKTFRDLRCPDPIITTRSKKLPEGAVIHDIGVGEAFIEHYKKKHKIT